MEFRLNPTLPLTLLILLSASISSLVLDIPPQIITNTISPSPNALRGPPKPPGFTMRLLMASSEPLDDEELYICAIEAMYKLVSEDMEEVVHTGQSRVVRGLQIRYHDVSPRPIDLRYKHIVLGILVAIDTMDRTNEFEGAVIELRQNWRKFGFIRMVKRNGRGIDGSEGGMDYTTINATATTAQGDEETENNISNPSLPRPSSPLTKNLTTLTNPKTLIDPTDRDIQILYTRFGTPLSCRTLFGAALDALATLSQDDDTDTIDMFTGENWSRKVVYQTFSEKTTYGEFDLLTVDVIKRAMRLLPQRLWRERSCGEVRFEMVVQGGRVGRGRFWVPDWLGKGEREGGEIE
ncbi:MAG: hypothetical protein Q9204_002551 [Flavoplaca sp. TL-2023a]